MPLLLLVYSKFDLAPVSLDFDQYLAKFNIITW
jgi:hypothetical protein